MRSYGRVGWIAVLVMFGVSALVMGRNAQLRAHSSNKIYASAEEVTKAFMNVIAVRRVAEDCTSDAMDSDWKSADIFSTREQAEFSAKEIQYMVEKLRQTWRLSGMTPRSWEVEEVASETGLKIVRVKEGVPVTPEIVSLRDGESWRINIRQTYMKWFNLKNDAELSTHLRGLTQHFCQSNLNRVAFATSQYIQDYDEKFPPAKDWQFVLWPYVKDYSFFHCPLSPEKSKGVGYAYNWKLNNKNMDAIESPPTMIVYYETSVHKPSHSGEGADMEYRHDKGINLAFADGHVKWYSKQDWPKPDSRAHFTFKQP